MDVQQLKLLAGRVRGLLEQSNHPLGHSQSLDLVAALTGLRNWPEVQAFPDRVAACTLDAASAGRLAFRLKKTFELELTPTAMLEALSPPGIQRPTRATQVWPTGPMPGIYVTTSQDAINALLERYEEATDGELVYAERAGSHWAGSIDLGEDGLWSSGLQRVPSGTLVVVGPVDLDQQSWEDNTIRMDKACLLAQEYQHRVAVLVNTPTPEALEQDIRLIVQSSQVNGDDGVPALMGIVTEDGEMLKRELFAEPRPPLTHVRRLASVDAIPRSTVAALTAAVENRHSGLLLFGSSVLNEHAAMELIAASLALTEHAGPAARILPRRRGTPSKDWLVPDAVKVLPFLPSVESAYDQGYRRMIFSAGYTKAETLLEFGDEVLLITGTYGSEVEDVFMGAVRGGRMREGSELLAMVIAILGVKPIPTRTGEVVASDLFVMPPVRDVSSMKYEEIIEFLHDQRAVRWQDEMGRLLDAGAVTVSAIKKALSRNQKIGEFLSGRAGRNRAA